MKKKVLTGLIMAIALMCISITAFALTDGDWEFQLLDDEVTITGYLGNAENIVIPSTIYGATVTKVECIAQNKNFKNAVSVTFPSTVKVIVQDLFDESKTLETVVLPEGVETLDCGVFARCTNLKNITLPSTIKTMKDHVFYECTSLTSINIPSELENLPLTAWANSSSVFEGSGLTSVDLSNCNLLELGSAMFANCKSLAKVKLNNNMTVIPSEFFKDCTALTDIELPASIKTIRDEAFRGCTSLKQIILPVSLKKIDSSAFYGCTGIKEVVIPYGTESISGSAFAGIPAIESIYIPDTVIPPVGLLALNGAANPIPNSKNGIIYCSVDSPMAKYCKEYGISYLTDKSVNSSITVYYNGTRISFHEYGQNPELINDRTLVPLRSIFEAMDASVQWDDATETVTSTRNGVTIKISIGENAIYKNGQAIPTDVPAQLINDRTMIPVRVIAEAFGADVQWNENGNAVLISE